MTQAAPTATLEELGRIAQMGPPLPRVSDPHAIAKVRYSHDAMIDMIIANPWISQGELAIKFGYTPGWVSQVLASDAFQHRLAERKAEIVDPAIKASFEERLRGLAFRSAQILQEKLDKPASGIPDNLAIKTLELAAKALGYGAAVHVVPLAPPPAADRLTRLGGRLVGLVQDAREGRIIDVTPSQETRNEEATPGPQRQDAREAGGAQPDGSQPNEAAIRADAGAARESA